MNPPRHKPAHYRAQSFGNRAPELEPRCGSWICTSPSGCTTVELFERADADKLALAGWSVKTAMQHLIDLNTESS